VDPATGRYSKTKYVASFIGFAPVNNPAITVAVILDSPVGLHQGGQVCAPVFKRIAQQVLEYLHVPHDLELKNPQRQALEASAQETDVDESSLHLGAPLPLDEDSTTRSTASTAQSAAGNNPEAMSEGRTTTGRPASPAGATAQSQPTPTASQDTSSASAEPTATNGTVVLDVDSGVIVPSFLGKPLRSAVETAEESGLEINAIGSGVAREQWPAPGSHLPAGQHITVRFAH